MIAYKKIAITCLSLLFFSAGNAEHLLRERVYLQTDKETYLAGEWVWIKLLTTDIQGIPLSVSKVGYVELLDENAAHSQIKIELQEGVGQGCMELPATLSTGNYRLVGYTRYMRNEGEDCFFEKNIGIVNTFIADGKIELLNEPLPVPGDNLPSTSIKLSSDRTDYSTRQTGILTIEHLPDNIKTLSVSIAGVDPVASAPNLLQWQKGLPKGELPSFSDEILPEYEGHIVKGKLMEIQTDREGYANDVIPMIGFTGEQIQVFNGKLTSDSQVCFYTTHISGTEEIVSSVFNDPDNRFRIDIESPFVASAPSSLPPLLLYEEQKEELLQRSIGMQAAYYYTRDSLNRFLPASPKFNWQPAWSYKLDEYTRFANIEETVIEYVRGLRFRRIGKQRMLSAIQENQSQFTYGNTLVLIDGIPLNNHDMIFYYDPALVEQLDVYRGMYVFGEHFFDGIAAFKTYHNDYPGLTANKSMQFYQYAGPQLKRCFYAPDYRLPENQNSRLPDFRHTLLWEPDVQTNGANEISIPFQTSDLTGQFRISVEGLTQSGACVYATLLIQTHKE